MSAFASLVRSLGKRDLILPYFETSIVAENWPESYNIAVDSSPYYGAGDGYFHPSTHPAMSELQLYYLFHPDYAGRCVFERPSLQREMTLAMGSALHAVLQTQMTMCGLVKPEDIEVEYINADHRVRGRIDWLSDHPSGQRILVEMKTRNSRSYPFTESPLDSWLAQVNLGLDSQDLDLGVLLMVESGYPYRMREFHVQRDRELLDALYAKFDRVRAAIVSDTPPEDFLRGCCGVRTTATSKCPCRHICWP